MSKTAVQAKPSAKIEFERIETDSGHWNVYTWPNGRTFREFRTDIEFFDLPLVSVTCGIDPRTKRMGHARGVIAIGQRASGVIAIGQFCSGYFSIGQFVTGRIAAIGQFTLAPLAIGQFAFAVAAISQFGFGGWGIFQGGAVVFGGIGQQLLHLFASLAQ